MSSCANCHKTGVSLKHCAKCKTTTYCSRDCQKNHFREHKKECVVNAVKYNANRTSTSNGNANGHPSSNSNNSTSNSNGNRSNGPNGTFDNSNSTTNPNFQPITTSTPMANNLGVHFDNPFSRLENGTWLDGRTESDEHKLLIDTYRLRMDDRYKFERVAESDGIYHGVDKMEEGVGGGVKGFRHFLTKIVDDRVFPHWWTEKKVEACSQ
jgi:splicing suppressor protein 51